MPQLVYRIQKARFVPTMLSGESARLYGGRWNPEGTPLVYTSASPELAVLETLVHLDGTPLADLPPFVQATLALPDNSVEIIPEVELPTDWQEVPGSEHVTQFLLPRLQPAYPFMAFAVPSTVSPGSPTLNILLNPLHPLIAQVQVVAVTPWIFDKRLRPEPVLPTPTKRASRAPTKRKSQP